MNSPEDWQRLKDLLNKYVEELKIAEVLSRLDKEPDLRENLDRVAELGRKIVEMNINVGLKKNTQ